MELRQPQLNLTTVARKESGGGAMPATGWDGRFDRVTGTLNLPPGHRLLAAIGTDGAPASWWERWGLWNVFGVLLIVGFVYWTAGLIPAAIAALALVLTYQEVPEFIWLWGNLLAALAIARAAPAGRFQKFASGYRTLSFVVLGIALLPFLWLQVRYALYPQLAPSDGQLRQSSRHARRTRRCRSRCMALMAESVSAAAADAAAAAAPPPEVDAITAEDMAELPDSNVRESMQRIPGSSFQERPQLRAGGAALRRRHGAAGRPRHSRLGIQLLQLLLEWPGRIRRHGALHLRGAGGAVLLAHPRRVRAGRAVRLAGVAELRQDAVALPGFPKAASAGALLPGLLASRCCC